MSYQMASNELAIHIVESLKGFTPKLADLELEAARSLISTTLFRVACAHLGQSMQGMIRDDAEDVIDSLCVAIREDLLRHAGGDRD